MAQVSLNTVRQSERLKQQVSAMMLEMLDSIIADCESGKRIAAEVWVQDSTDDYCTRYGEGEITAYDDVIQNLQKWRKSIEADSIQPPR